MEGREIIHPDDLNTIQDLGRKRYQGHGDLHRSPWGEVTVLWESH